VIAHQGSKSLIRCKMSPRTFQTLCLTDSRFVSQISTFVSPTTTPIWIKSSFFVDTLDQPTYCATSLGH
jgi:hypothetical protein